MRWFSNGKDESFLAHFCESPLEVGCRCWKKIFCIWRNVGVQALRREEDGHGDSSRNPVYRALQQIVDCVGHLHVHGVCRCFFFPKEVYFRVLDDLEAARHVCVFVLVCRDTGVGTGVPICFFWKSCDCMHLHVNVNACMLAWPRDREWLFWCVTFV